MNDSIYLGDAGFESVDFCVSRPDGGWRRVFTLDYVQEIRPVAETLAMMDKRPTRDYGLYLHEADAIYRFKQGEVSWVRDDEDPIINDLLQQIKMIKKLKGTKNENIR